ncbi:MAG: serine hydrolase domain-containing protein [Myxococcota bacterium]
MGSLLLVVTLACRQAAPPEDSGLDGDPTLEVASPYKRADRRAIREAALTDLSRNLASGVQIAVWLEGQIVYEGQFGSAHPERQIDVTSQTLFQIGSDVKKIAAVSLLQQVEAGRLSLDDTVASALPGVSLEADPAWATTATLEDLLTHQSGLYNYTPWDEAPADRELADRASGVLSESAYMLMPPRTTWNYTNAGFSLVGLAAEVADGRPWPAIVEEDIFAPLGMTRTVVRRPPVSQSEEWAAATGLASVPGDAFDLLDLFDQTPEITTLEGEQLTDNGFVRPAGLTWSTATDMARFGGFLVDGNREVLSDSLREALTTRHAQPYAGNPSYAYGYGIMVFNGFTLSSEYYREPIWQHGGNTLAMTSTIIVLPEQRLSISVLSNGLNDVMGQTASALLKGADVLGAPTGAPDLDTSRAPNAELIGTYVDRGLGAIVVTEDEGSLRVDLPELSKRGVAVSPSLQFAGLRDVYTMTIGGQSLEVVFGRDDDGDVEYVYNRLFAGRRDAETGGGAGASMLDVRRLAWGLLEPTSRPLFVGHP